MDTQTLTEMDDEMMSANDTGKVAHTLTLTKPAGRALAADKIKTQVEYVMARISIPTRINRGWVAEWSGDAEVVAREGKAKDYVVTLKVSCTPKTKRGTLDSEFAGIVASAGAAAGVQRWKLTHVDGNAYDTERAVELATSAEEFVGYAPIEIPSNWRDFFGKVYDRDAHINELMRRIRTAIDSDFTKRFHAVLAGPPACGKTEITQCMVRMFGKDAVMVLDGTAMTAAGIAKELSEREELPRIMVIEEIEKGDEAALRIVLGIADTRGEIRKLTARGKIERQARCIVVATVNDYNKLEGMLAGALASRLGKQVIWFPRPTRELMAKVLHREVADINGDVRWIEHTLEYIFSHGTADMRQAIQLCLCGREAWLTGNYAKELAAISQRPTDY